MATPISHTGQIRVAAHQLIKNESGFQCAVCQISWKKRPVSQCPGFKVYAWGQVPNYLKTKSQLDALRLSCADLTPSGCLTFHRSWIPLYDSRQASPKRPLSERQK